MSLTELRVDVPPDVEVEDRVIGPLTFRHLGYLAVAGGGVAAAALHPSPATVAAGVLLAAVGLVGAWWRPQGRPLDAWVAPALAYRRRISAAAALRAPDVSPTTRLEVRDDQPGESPPSPSTELSPPRRSSRAALAASTTDTDTGTEPAADSGVGIAASRQARRPWTSWPQVPRPSRRTTVVIGAALVAIVAVNVVERPHSTTRPSRPAATPPTATGQPTPRQLSPAPAPAPVFPPTQLSDEEVDDAVDAIFDWLTGP